MQNDSLDFDALPDAEEAVELPPEVEQKEDRTPSEKICPACEKPIYKEPGKRGRVPKYHPECKPSIAGRVSTARTRTASTNAKAEKEADAIIARFKSAVLKGVFAAGAMPQFRYEAFVVMANLNDVCQNLKGVLVQYDALRKDLLRINTGGSIIGLIFSVVAIILPILAFRGLIPGKQISQILVNLPVVMAKIAKRMQEGEEAVADMMNRGAEEMLHTFQRERAEKRATEEAATNASAGN